MDARKNAPYEKGELDTILSLVPTEKNIKMLSELLQRSEKAIELVYKLAYERGSFGKDAKAQEKKILSAKKRLGIKLGRTKPRP